MEVWRAGRQMHREERLAYHKQPWRKTHTIGPPAHYLFARDFFRFPAATIPHRTRPSCSRGPKPRQLLLLLLLTPGWCSIFLQTQAPCILHLMIDLWERLNETGGWGWGADIFLSLRYIALTTPTGHLHPFSSLKSLWCTKGPGGARGTS